MSDNYILEGHTPVKERDLIKWAKWYESADRQVARTKRVSTVFLGIDHAFRGGKPVLFETMVFGGPLDGEQERYCTWDEAVDGHHLMVVRDEAAS